MFDERMRCDDHGGGAGGAEPTHVGDWRELDRQMRRLARRRAVLDAEEVQLLVAAKAAEVHRHLGYGSFDEYLECVLGYAPTTARDRMRVAVALDDLPALRAALAAGEVTFSAVRELTRGATADTEQAWLDAIPNLTPPEGQPVLPGPQRGPWGAHAGRSVPSAMGFIALAIGIMGLWPDHGFVALLNSRTEGGMMLRGLLPAALIFPLALGGIMERGARLGWFDHTFSLALNLGITSIIFVGLVLLIGLLLKRREAERRAAMAERDALLAQLQASVEELQKLQTNFVTVCAWTKRVLDEGKWVKFEEFLEKRLHISTSHGISEDAASEELSALLDADADADRTIGGNGGN